MRFARRRVRTTPPVHTDPEAVGLPALVDPPSPSRLAEFAEQLDADIAANAKHGLPLPGHPARPLLAEEAGIRLHATDQQDRTQWASQADAQTITLRDTARSQEARLTVDQAENTGKIIEAEARVVRLGGELTEPDRRHPRLRPLLRELGALAFLGAFGLEVNALQPVVGIVVRVPGATAWGFTTFVVAVITAVSWTGGWSLRRWLAYEGPRRVRVAYALGALLTMASAVIAVIGVVDLRLAGGRTDVPGEVGLIYLAVQAGVELLAIGHGFWHGDPRVRELRGALEQLAGFRVQAEELDDALLETGKWAESLEEFSTAAWLPAHRQQLAESYAGVVLAKRQNRWDALMDSGFTDSADVLLLLPLPKFEVPDDDGPDDFDWLTGGFVLTL